MVKAVEHIILVIIVTKYPTIEAVLDLLTNTEKNIAIHI